MNKFNALIPKILAILATAPSTDNNIVLAAELRLMLKRAQYTAIEGERGLWDGLSITLNRYLAPPTSSAWAAEISALVTAA